MLIYEHPREFFFRIGKSVEILDDFRHPPRWKQARRRWRHVIVQLKGAGRHSNCEQRAHARWCGNVIRTFNFNMATIWVRALQESPFVELYKMIVTTRQNLNLTHGKKQGRANWPLFSPTGWVVVNSSVLHENEHDLFSSSLKIPLSMFYCIFGSTCSNIFVFW